MYRYGFKYDGKSMARAVGRALSISYKHAIEISNYIKGKKLSVAQELLEKAIKKEKPIPFKRFTEGAGHKKGNIMAGKYVVKAATEILKLLREVEANASAKGFYDPIIIYIAAKKASSPYHYGRHYGREMKRTNVEVIVKASEEEKLDEKKKENMKATKKESRKESKNESKKMDQVDKGNKMNEDNKIDNKKENIKDDERKGDKQDKNQDVKTQREKQQKTNLEDSKKSVSKEENEEKKNIEKKEVGNDRE